MVTKLNFQRKNRTEMHDKYWYYRSIERLEGLVTIFSEVGF